MTSENQTPQSQNPWMEKGLGWLPDYPDLRDYQLDKVEIQKGGRLTLEETTRNLEGLADSVIDALNLLRNEFSEEESKLESLQSLIDKLQTKVFDNISFLSVRLRKILRPTSKKLESLSPSLALLLNERDTLWMQSIHDLKTYLYLYLFPKGNPDTEIGSEILEVIRFHKLDNFNYLIQWIKDLEFDDPTIAMIQAFHSCNGENTEQKSSSTVGPYTYHKLSQALREQVKPENKDFQASFLSSLKSIPPVQLISISSLISSEVVESIFKVLIKIAAEELSQEISDPNKSDDRHLWESDVFNCNKNQDYPEEGEPSFKTILAPTIQSKTSLTKNNEIEALLVKDFSSCLQQDNYSENLYLEQLFEIFNNEFKVIEPLISVILELIMPLASAKYRNWNEAIVDGFRKFDLLTNKSDESAINSPSDASQYDVFLKFLATEALQKTCQEIKEGLELVTGEIVNLKSDLHNLESSYKQGNNSLQVKSTLGAVRQRYERKQLILGPTLYLYFILIKFFRFYCRKLEINHSTLLNGLQSSDLVNAQNAQGNQGNQGNFFDKREALEIETPERFYRGDFSEERNEHREQQQQKDGNQQTSNFELFPTETLQIPILLTLPRLLGLNYLDARTSGYLFLPGVVDLSFWCTPVRDQGSLKSCTAIAGVSLMEYFVNRSQGKYTELSALFLYKVARQQLDLSEDVGASLRETMKAMALHGVPPESVWKYDPAKVNEEPPPFCYSYAQNYQALKYFRLDYAGISSVALLFQIKAMLASGFPSMFGFTIYTSAYEDANAKQGWIPFPDAQRDKIRGGHAVVAVGYDDYKLLPRSDRKGYSLGAFLIRNCWGKEWGKAGYGWLPYDYVRQGLTYDWWSLLKAEWFELDLIGAGSSNLEGPKWPLQASLLGDIWRGFPGQGGEQGS